MPSAVTVAALSAEEARALTDRIRSTAENLCDLLYQAHQGKAFRVLGYDAWEDYVSAEFSMGRTYSYRLLAQARVIETLEEAAGVNLSPSGDIPEAVARDIAPVLPFVVDDVRDRVSAGVEPRQAVREAIEEARAPLLAERRNGKAPAPPVIEPEPEDEHAPDLVDELERADAEILRLTGLVESLSASDQGREIASWSAKYAQLNARLNQAIATGNESAKQAKAYGITLGRVRALLGVESNKDIVPAIEDLKR